MSARAALFAFAASGLAVAPGAAGDALPADVAPAGEPLPIAVPATELFALAEFAADDGRIALAAGTPLGIDGRTLTLHPERVVHREAFDARSIHGSLSGEHGHFVLTWVGDALAGAVWTSDGAYDLRPTGQTDAAGDPIVRVIDLGDVALPACSGHPAPARGAVDLPVADQPLQDPDNLVTVLVGVTPEARAQMGGFNSARATAIAAVDATNTAYINSEVGNGLRVELVGFVEVPVEPFGQARSLLRRVTNQSDGDLDDLARAREAYNADLVAVLSAQDTQVCGIAWLSPGSEAFGYSITAWPCAVGNLTFAHELGHNYGCSHDIANAGGPLAPYAVGWNWQGQTGNPYRTVMSTSSGGGRQRLAFFSNPDVSFDGGATGDSAGGDNTRWLEENSGLLANYRQGSPIDADCDGNGRPDAAEVALDPSLDANANGQLDACELLAGTLEDCNNNNEPDIAEIRPRVFRDLGPVTPVGPGTVSLSASNVPEAFSNVAIRLQAHADLSSDAEFLDLSINGVFQIRLFQFDGNDCDTPGPRFTLNLTAAEWNAFGPNVTLSFQGTSEINPDLCSSETYVGGQVEYIAIDRSNDADGDGILDACAGPCSPADLAAPFGQLTFGDISAFLAAFDAQDPAADLASPFGQFTFGDISAFLAAFSTGCP
jgi:hypothetical protein